jgi:hypothetical protein
MNEADVAIARQKQTLRGKNTGREKRNETDPGRVCKFDPWKNENRFEALKI